MTGENRRRLSQAQISNFWRILKSLPIEIYFHQSIEHAESILHLAREYKLTTYDAAYLNVAMIHSASLATLDKDLIKAARRCGVKII